MPQHRQHVSSESGTDYLAPKLKSYQQLRGLVQQWHALHATHLMPDDGTFKWEESGALNHHCPVCQTPLTSHRAKTTCYGKHVEPCVRYHQGLRAIGKGHECYACRNTIAIHYQRHRQIAETLQELRSQTPKDGETSASTLPNVAARAQTRIESVSLVSAENDASPASARSANEPGSGDGDAAAGLQRKDSKKIRKAANKMTKALQRPKVITTKDIDHVANVVHAASVSAAHNGTVSGAYIVSEDLQTDNAVTSNPHLSNDLLDVQEARTSCAPSITPDRLGNKVLNQDTIPETEMTRILMEFGLPRNVSAMNKTKRSLMNRLVVDIKDDLAKFRTERRETMTRKAGYWRYVNKTVYSNMAANNEIVNWETGERLTSITGSSGNTGDRHRSIENPLENDDEDQWEFATACEDQVVTPIETLCNRKSQVVAHTGLDKDAVEAEVHAAKDSNATRNGPYVSRIPIKLGKQEHDTAEVPLQEITNNAKPHRATHSEKQSNSVVSGSRENTVPRDIAARDLVAKITQNTASPTTANSKQAVPQDIAAKEVLAKITQRTPASKTVERKQAVQSAIAAQEDCDVTGRVTATVPLESSITDESGNALHTLPQVADRPAIQNTTDASTQTSEADLPPPPKFFRNSSTTAPPPPANSTLPKPTTPQSINPSPEALEEEELVYLYRVYRKGPFKPSKAQQVREREMPKYKNPAFMASETDMQELIRMMHGWDLEDGEGSKKRKRSRVDVGQR